MIFLREFLILSIIVIFSAGCFAKCHKEERKKVNKTYSSKLKSERITVRLEGKITGYLPSFREGINIFWGEYYLYYLNKNKELVFVPVFNDGETHKISLKNYLPDRRFSTPILIEGTKLYILSDKTFQVYILNLSKDFKIVEEDDFNFSHAIDTSRFFLKSNINQPFQKLGNQFYFPIESSSKKKKFVDKYSYLVVEEKKMVSSKVLDAPEEYKKGERHSKYTFIYPYNSSEALYMFESIDRVMVFNTMTNSIKASYDFNPYSDYASFDYSQRRDLGYIRHYTLTNEFIAKILCDTRNFVVIKKVRKMRIHEKSQYEYLTINSDFKLQNFDLINHDINPYISFLYKDGFVVVDVNLRDAYYYK